MRKISLAAISLFFVMHLSADAAAKQVLVVPPNAREVVIDIQTKHLPSDAKSWRLVEIGGTERQLPVQLSPAPSASGTIDNRTERIVAVIPPAENAREQRRFELREGEVPQPHQASQSSRFTFTPATDKSIKLSDGKKPVFAYVHEQVTKESVPESDGRRVRGCFVHPLWGLDGEVLTASFPPDHYHHHGIFWAWPAVHVGDQRYDHWEQRKFRTKKIREITRETGPLAAVIAYENGWFTETGKQLMTERVWIHTWPEHAGRRAIDFEMTLTPNQQDVTLGGRKIKGYGGFTLRYDVWPRKTAEVRVPGTTIVDTQRRGQLVAGDVVNQPLPWADLSDTFRENSQTSGAAVFIHPSHPDYPPTWLTRCYGALCVGWPGEKTTTLKVGESVTLRYRVLVHRGTWTDAELAQAYDDYLAAAKVKWQSPEKSRN